MKVTSRTVVILALTGVAVVLTVVLWRFGTLSDANCDYTFGRVEIQSFECDSLAIVPTQSSAVAVTLPDGSAGKLHRFYVPELYQEFYLTQIDVVCDATGTPPLFQVGGLAETSTVTLSTSYYTGRGCGSHDLFIESGRGIAVATPTSTVAVNLWIVNRTGIKE